MEHTIGILLADLTGYSALTEMHGAEVAMQTVDNFTMVATASLAGDSRLLERTGDQLVIVAEDPDDLARTALTLMKRASGLSYFPGVHAGLHYGTVVEKDGHIYGTAINLAARIAAEAGENEILCSSAFVDALSSVHEFRTVSRGLQNFRNIMTATEVFELLPLETMPAKQFTDPVCHMHVHEHESIAYTVNNATYYFCSYDCKESFTAHQQKYMLHKH